MNLDALEQLWLAVMKMGTEVRKKTGIELSPAFELLRAAKPFLNECRLDAEAGEQAEPEFLVRAEEMIHSAQRDIYLAGESLGKNFIEGWDDVFGRVMRGERIGEFPLSKPSFRPGMPQGNWVMIKPPKALGAKKLSDIAKAHGLKLEKRDEGYILIGNDSSIREALKEVKEALRQARVGK